VLITKFENRFDPTTALDQMDCFKLMDVAMDTTFTCLLTQRLALLTTNPNSG
ncbi:10728_t:CDS:1, partial [Scutellospora calospora]